MNGPVLFAEHLEYVLGVVKGLNEMPTSSTYYLHVELREEGTHERVALFSDEISATDHSVDFDVEPRDKNTPPVETEPPDGDVLRPTSAEEVLVRLKAVLEGRRDYLRVWAQTEDDPNDKIVWTERARVCDDVLSAIERGEQGEQGERVLG